MLAIISDASTRCWREVGLFVDSTRVFRWSIVKFVFASQMPRARMQSFLL